jgi:hypothetical protein
MDFLRPTKRSYESVDLERGGEAQLNVWRGEGKVKSKEKGNPSFFAQMTIYDCVFFNLLLLFKAGSDRGLCVYLSFGSRA